jgi:hypothetical protein
MRVNQQQGEIMRENREQPYTVAQLISELQKLPSDMRVMITGYEGGYHDGGAPTVKDIRLNVHEEEFYGPHDDADQYDEGESVKAAIL